MSRKGRRQTALLLFFCVPNAFDMQQRVDRYGPVAAPSLLIMSLRPDCVNAAMRVCVALFAPRCSGEPKAISQRTIKILFYSALLYSIVRLPGCVAPLPVCGRGAACTVAGRGPKQPAAAGWRKCFDASCDCTSSTPGVPTTQSAAGHRRCRPLHYVIPA